MNENDINIITKLVGEFSPSQLQNLTENLESYLHPDFSMFIPVYKYCDYAVSPDHIHPGYSFIYNINQKGSLVVNGKMIEGSEDFTSCIAVFSPDVKHHEIIEEGFSDYIAVFIDKNYFENAVMESGFGGYMLFEGACFPPDENVFYLLKLLMLEYNTKGHESTPVVESLISLITHQLVRVVNNDNLQSSPLQSSNKIDNAIAFMHENLSNKLTVADIAKHVNVSSSHFSKLFKDFTNKTPIEYLTRIRLEQAKRLLKLSDKNLTEIAFECGYSSSSYFSHNFIETVKLTPSEYRKKFRLEENIDKTK